MAPASSVASDPIAINLNPSSINADAAAASAANIPATLLLAFAAANNFCAGFDEDWVLEITRYTECKT